MKPLHVNESHLPYNWRHVVGDVLGSEGGWGEGRRSPALIQLRGAMIHSVTF